MHARRWTLLIALAIMAVGRPAAAQRVWEAEGTVNAGFTQTTQGTFLADPMADAEDRPASSTSTLFTEIRPSVSVQSGTDRLVWRVGYQFAGNVTLDSTGATTYNNQLETSLAAQASKFTTVSLSASIAQGGTQFLLTSRAADAGQAEIRAPGNPNLIATSVGESLSTDIGRRMTLHQNLIGTASSPQDDLGNYSAALAGSLGVDRAYIRNAIGLEARSTISRLQPLQADSTQYTSLTNALVARWNRDFSYRWNGIATAGVEQVYTDTGSKPLAISPTASAAALYTARDHAIAIEASHSTVTNIQVGTIAVSDRISARGLYTLDIRKARALTFSVGFLHNTPIGESEAVVAAGTGNAVQLDSSFITEINKTLLFTARYSAAFQFGQAGGLDSTLAHIVLVGVTARYSNVDRLQMARPRRAIGQRVDRSDGLFPVIDEAPVAP